MKLNFRLVLVFVLLAILLNGPEPQPARANFPANATLSGDLRVNALIAKAEQNGPQPVIVSLNLPIQPEGELSVPLAAAQVNRIEAAQTGLLKHLEGRPVQNMKQFEHIPALALTLDAGSLRLLRDMPEVASIIEDKPVKVSLAESTKLIQALPANTGGYTGTGWAVAVLDTGVDKTHPFLAGKVISEACYSSNNLSYGSTSVCPGGLAKSIASGSGVNCKVSTECIHGTHVAGIIAGKGASYSGVARDAKIIAIQVFSAFPPSMCGIQPCVMSFTSDQILGLERVYSLRNTYKIAAVNLSLGGGSFSGSCDQEDPAYLTAVENLRSAGIATIAASGNDGDTSGIAAPACLSNVYSVGSTDDGSAHLYTPTLPDAVSYFSNVHSNLDFFAPGQWITSSIPGGKYDTLRGTSMAAPHVAGAWALLRSSEPNAKIFDIYTALRDTGKPISFLSSGEGLINRPRISVGPAITRLHLLVKPTVSFDTATFSILERSVPVTVTVRLSRSYTATVTVNYATTTTGTATAGQDYTPTSGKLTFSPGQTSKSFQVPILTDTLAEPAETIGVQLTNLVNTSNTGPVNATIVIIDDETAKYIYVPLLDK